MDDDQQTHEKLGALKLLVAKNKNEKETQQGSPISNRHRGSLAVPGIISPVRSPGPSRAFSCTRATPQETAAAGVGIPLVPGNDYGAAFVGLPAQAIIRRHEEFKTVCSPSWAYLHLNQRQGSPGAVAVEVADVLGVNGEPYVSVGNPEINTRGRVTNTTLQEEPRLGQMPQRETRPRENAPKLGRRKAVNAQISDLASLDGLIAELQCSFCKNVPTPPPVICTAGHLSCKPCIAGKQTELLTCPFAFSHSLCGKPFVDGTSKLFEYLYNNSRFVCAYAESGCSETPLGCDIKTHIKNCGYRPTVRCPFSPCSCSKAKMISSAYMVRHMEAHGVPIVEGGSFRLRTDYSKVDIDPDSMTPTTQKRWVDQVMMFDGYYFSIVIEIDGISVVIWCSHMCDTVTSDARKFDAKIKLTAETGSTTVSWEGEAQNRDTKVETIVANGDCLSISKSALRHKFVYPSYDKLYWNTDVLIWERQKPIAEAQLTSKNLPQPFPPYKPMVRIPGSTATVAPGPVEAEIEPRVIVVNEFPLAEEVTSTTESSASHASISDAFSDCLISNSFASETSTTDVSGSDAFIANVSACEKSTIEASARDTASTIGVSASATTPTIEASTSDTTSAIEASACATMPTIEVSASATTPTIEASTSDTTSAIEASACAITPTIEASTSATTPTIEASASATTLTIEVSTSATTPTIEVSASATTPTIEASASATTPTIEVSTSATTPTIEVSTSATTSTIDVSASATTPTIEASAIATTPTIEVSASATTPTIEASAMATTPTIEASASGATTPTIEASASATTPTVETSAMATTTTIEASASGATTPTIEASARGSTTPTYEASASDTSPTIEASASDTAPTIEASASDTTPTIEASVSATTPTIEASASATTPTIEASASATTPTIEASASATMPTIEASASATMPTIEASASATTPTIEASASATMPTIEASASATTPTIEASTSDNSTTDASATEALTHIVNEAIPAAQITTPATEDVSDSEEVISIDSAEEKDSGDSSSDEVDLHYDEDTLARFHNHHYMD